MKQKSNIGLYGNFGIQVFEHKSGKPERIFRIQKKNQITNGGRNALLALMMPGDYTVPSNDAEIQLKNRIWSLAIGTNATPTTITDVLSTMSIAWNEAFVLGSECIVDPVDYHIEISKTVPLAAAVGSTITEAGIVTRGDNDVPSSAADKVLYARQTHSPILKTATMTIQYDWQLGITIQS